MPASPAPAPKELLSALADGELHGPVLDSALADVCADPQAQQDWQTYHLIGDVLRDRTLACHGQHDLWAALRTRLAQPDPDNTATAPAALPPRMPTPALPSATALSAANDEVWRWKAIAGFTTLSAALALGWALVDTPLAISDGEQIAAVQSAVTPPSQAAVPSATTATLVRVDGLTQPQVVLRDPRLDALLRNHQQYAPRAPLQPPAEFLRNAGFADTAAQSTTTPAVRNKP